MSVELENVYRELLESSEKVSGRNLGMWRGGLLVANASLARIPEFVIQLAHYEFESKRAVPSALRLNGLEIWIENLNIGHMQSPCLILRSKDGQTLEMFFALVSHLLNELPKSDAKEVSPASVESIIEEWVEFWKRVRNVVDKKKIQGLLGELLALDRWIDMASFQPVFWQGPKGGPHDFCGRNLDIEVKLTSKRTGVLSHEISSIHQLEPSEGKSLHVLSFRAGLSKTGASSLKELVSRISSIEQFTTPEGRTWLNEALRDAGYSEDLDEDLCHFDLWDEALYRVEAGFPRLTRASLPDDPRVFNVNYSVNFGGCQEFLVTNEPVKLNLQA